MTLIKDLIKVLEKHAPPMYQESYDNSGLLIGNVSQELSGVLLCLDSTEAIIEEAIQKKCNLVIAHHPIIFKGLKRLTGKNYIERTVIKAIQHNIAIYAIHTNLDNMFVQGVNSKFAERLGLINTKILAPISVDQEWSLSSSEQEIAAFKTLIPQEIANTCFNLLTPTGSQLQFKARNDQKGLILNLIRKHKIKDYKYQDTKFASAQVGSGMLGYLEKPMEEKIFLAFLKERMQTACIKHTALLGKKIEKVALCGGAGGFLLSKAIQQKADIFITSDYKYHEFFDADGKIIIADIGHYESEQFTIQLLAEIISNNFSNFAVYETELKTNPVSYFV